VQAKSNADARLCYQQGTIRFDGWTGVHITLIITRKRSSLPTYRLLAAIGTEVVMSALSLSEYGTAGQYLPDFTRQKKDIAFEKRPP
jgi:hypothetical protein